MIDYLNERFEFYKKMDDNIEMKYFILKCCTRIIRNSCFKNRFGNLVFVSNFFYYELEEMNDV